MYICMYIYMHIYVYMYMENLLHLEGVLDWWRRIIIGTRCLALSSQTRKKKKKKRWKKKRKLDGAACSTNGKDQKWNFPRHRRRGLNKHRSVALGGGRRRQVILFVYEMSEVARGYTSWCLATMSEEGEKE